MHKYRLLSKKGEGTFSEVLKAQCIKNGKYVAIKCMKNHFDSLEQVNNLREIQALRRLSPNQNIIKLLEVLYDQPTGRLALVFELMDMNVYEMIKGRRHYIAEEKVKNYMYQLIKAMDHMHSNGIFHRDVKPENILIMDDMLKVADFGSCRGIYSKQPYTEYISTRWYRAPECILTDGYYTYKMDMWGVGCVFFEIMSLYPLFPGTNELDQIEKIHNMSGTPAPEVLAKMKRHSNQQHIDFNFPHKEGSGIEKLVPHVSQECCDLLNKLLAYNPDERISARQALKHPYFREFRDKEKWAQKHSEKSSDSRESSRVRYNRVNFGASSSNQEDESDDAVHSHRTHRRRHRHNNKLESENSDKHLPSIRKRKVTQQEHHEEASGHNSYLRNHDKYGSTYGGLSKENSLASVSSDIHLDTDRDGPFQSNLPPIAPSLSMHSISGRALVKLHPTRNKVKEVPGHSLYHKHLEKKHLERKLEKKNLEKPNRATYNFPSGRGHYGHSQAYTRIKHHHKRKTARDKEQTLQVTGKVKSSNPSHSYHHHQQHAKGGLSHTNVKYISPYSRRALGQANQ
ncbi:mitogen-activated protein kinase [Chloropicon primus]|uniref:Mitogen-activated protein kinase n=1 Tax=Chloropicon primus TaxID=1764295 RepID=A0A5B8ME98_9CHLO|nr:mitogen-activated protein kinase [Chloropicon primus]UPQ97960.1 mitogen-activated protein kinase [Chloropicon primus]|eukprot:QDZ18753.1 mitogen-activated protein kinase [Chloropicon primus]